MADGYEPTSAVSQGAAAGAAMFGAPQPNQALGYAQLQQDRQRMQQQGQLAQQGMQADERRAQEQQQQFQQGADLQREQMAATSKEGGERRAHEQKMEQQRQQYEQQLQQQVFDRQQALKIAELEFAKANAETREKLAPKLMQQRKDVANLNGKLTANRLLNKEGRGRLKEITEHFGDMKKQIEDANKAESDIGIRSATSAGNRIYEEIMNQGKDGYGKFKMMLDQVGIGDIGDEDMGFDLINLRPDIVDEVAGGLVPQDLKTRLELAGRAIGEKFDSLTGGYAGSSSNMKSLASIDEAKVSARANQLVTTNIARAISEQTGDKIAPAQIQSIINDIFKGGDDVGDQAVLLNKMQQSGVSPTVIKSALLNLANSLDGTDEMVAMPGQPKPTRSSLNRIGIKEKMAALPEGSAQYMALEASLKLIDQMQAKARVAASQLPTPDLDGLDSGLKYIQRAVQGGGSLNRDELLRLIPTYLGSNADDDLRERIGRDTILGDIERLGADPFGQLNREDIDLQKQIGDLGITGAELGDELEMLKEGRSRDLGGLISTMRGIR